MFDIFGQSLLSKTHPENPETSFVSIKQEKKSPESLLNQEAESSKDDDQFDNEYDDFEAITEDKKLFFCPEEGCIKSFQRYSSYQKHLDSERHKHSLENMTLYDKTIVLNSVLFSFEQAVIHIFTASNNCALSNLVKDIDLRYCPVIEILLCFSQTSM